MRFIKFLVVMIIFLGVAGYGVLHFGTKFASEKIVDTLSTELESSGQKEEIKNTIENDPQLKAYMEEAKTVDSSTLPFTTKEEATKVLIQKVGITELNDIRVKLQDGSMTQEEALQMVEGKLSDEELAALKVIVYQELYQ
ncbi:MAG TPA: hypothetical protein DEB37_04570 [Lysinibacillus sp.]|uniref:Phenylalanyl-tRNA synthetase subunit beta n=1 Tax=Lysinibacillus fusiformis TaxID=28031 RepID=A0A2I0UYT2_9BACI|nr:MULTISPECIES: hypothetical protein [Lysinibacillus]HBT71554.1 hypothetical protein [Lysinibacillus sp.]KUF37341.1 phenylalanyl-tRNA synthetase subunit beta [Lysinibacillus sp. F5]MEE3809620.1 hypothetical protein [Lysinibacillus fusiformis]PKU51211.1 hypothetical protein CRI88_10775 [Lysinibacillus fusiformis]WCH49632.1 hypothetical protein NV349_09695 [Lysinibacillus sp. OF-1]